MKGLDAPFVKFFGLISTAAFIASSVAWIISGYIVPKGVTFKDDIQVWWLKQTASYDKRYYNFPLPLNILLLCAARIIIHVTGAGDSKGSGLPEIRSMLSGATLHGKLDAKVGVVKCVCLSLALIAELPLGTEGPFAHMSACIVYGLVNCFKGLATWVDNSTYVRRTLLLTMVVVGSAATLGSPVGGAVLGIELTLPQPIDHFKWLLCFIAATVGSLIRYFLKMAVGIGGSGHFDTLLSTDIDDGGGDSSYTFTDDWENYSNLILLCIPLGILCGIFGSLFVTVQDWAGKTYKAIRQKAGCKPNGARELIIDLLIIAVVVWGNSMLSSWEPTNAKGCPAILELLFRKKWKGAGEDFMRIPVFEGLALFFVLRLVLTAFVIRLPVPTGAVAPCLVLGAVFGRFYAHAVLANQDFGEKGQMFFAWFAILGASAFTGAVWRTFAIVVTIFELLGVKEIIVPLAGTTLIAMTVSNRLTTSILDSIMIFKNLKGVPLNSFLPWGKCIITVKERMHANYTPYVLPRFCDKSKLLEKIERLSAMSTTPALVAIVEHVQVDGSSGDVLVGGIEVSALDEVCASAASFDTLDMLAIASQRRQFRLPTIFRSDVPLMQAHSHFHEMRPGEFHIGYVTNQGLCQGFVTEDLLQTKTQGEFDGLDRGFSKKLMSK